MIFVILGTQKFQFNRLLQKIDELIEKGVINESVIAQIGYSTYKVKNYKVEKFLDKEAYNYIIEKSNLIICHGGTGAIINSVSRNKKVIAVPRLKEFGEHVDNHQCEIVEQFNNMNYIKAIYDIEELENVINSIKNEKFDKYISSTKNIISIIDNYIKGL
ncbi:MAG: PssE/Cps14G family polysaccharide biosynthesis glycosyltransferase [Clostridium sp.]|uniref:PssE/Cps14G family polysaccharide biosynthesis glycosyltransferase n=1 Tax=Clostridium sp. TaxID=1506 RepID=UPI0028FF417E|nr:PssE/Cps14G family polysaccharide biosynthesis glycosyltransferase [Clostridium sp.]MDU1936652.1 PssE/Cps14G family polysaccharide biosynthesis glycosyltransferase [Clostridium sp.]MDU2045331.1 PssE/Cps14G family polysaccharide biosynthesis glycosyltransferase [Clostridium sp.]